ncbi:hypothetical protein MJG53_013769 [Ovis ammon polii x Ovis aries]|uniref:Uncharacterized protein n=1 Tax=Ovis ammon polii x Ovis aries TaxID=2918886 RepID=A0ACB9UJT1_9CETA|nr:hypothetical protein MJG53_013769 [Ovis ammon polii x Ovis aries]
MDTRTVPRESPWNQVSGFPVQQQVLPFTESPTCEQYEQCVTMGGAPVGFGGLCWKPSTGHRSYIYLDPDQGSIADFRQVFMKTELTSCGQGSLSPLGQANPCRSRSLIPISHESKLSLALRLPPAALRDQGLVVLHEALAPMWQQLLDMRERKDYISTEEGRLIDNGGSSQICRWRSEGPRLPQGISSTIVHKTSGLLSAYRSLHKAGEEHQGIRGTAQQLEDGQSKRMFYLQELAADLWGVRMREKAQQGKKQRKEHLLEPPCSMFCQTLSQNLLCNSFMRYR